MLPILYTPEEVAEILKVSRVTLTRWRKEGFGPKFIRLGTKKWSRVRYPEGCLEAYIAECPGVEEV